MVSSRHIPGGSGGPSFLPAPLPWLDTQVLVSVCMWRRAKSQKATWLGCVCHWPSWPHCLWGLKVKELPSLPEILFLHLENSTLAPCHLLREAGLPPARHSQQVSDFRGTSLPRPPGAAPWYKVSIWHSLESVAIQWSGSWYGVLTLVCARVGVCACRRVCMVCTHMGKSVVGLRSRTCWTTSQGGPVHFVFSQFCVGLRQFSGRLCLMRTK